jgi:hypothetical protein
MYLYSGVNISQFNQGGQNWAVGTRGNDTIRQFGTNGTISVGFGGAGNDRFVIGGNGNRGIQFGGSGNDSFTVTGTNGAYALVGGTGTDTLNLGSGYLNYRNAYYNPTTNNAVYAVGINRVV